MPKDDILSDLESKFSEIIGICNEAKKPISKGTEAHRHLSIAVSTIEGAKAWAMKSVACAATEGRY
jgi:hypothetical protein